MQFMKHPRNAWVTPPNAVSCRQRNHCERLHHHEQLYGSGYPRGLKSSELLLEARILAVSDVVEALSTHQPYRLSLGIDVALEEIERNKGRFYDFTVVESCLTLFREKGLTLDYISGKHP